MSLSLKRELLAALREEYRDADYQQKKLLLQSFVRTTGYNRKYAIALLMRSESIPTKKRTRKPKYGSEVLDALLLVWRAAGYICSKRLIPFLPEFVPILERCEYLSLDSVVREKLLKLSAATADRLLKTERKRLGKSRSTTRRGNLLRAQIPVRTFADWDQTKPGFFEIDLVAHNGGITNGQCVHTFTLTDVASGWTELHALLNKGEDQVLAAIPRVRRVLPIELLGVDSDNGGEFINHKLSDYCGAEDITFTRAREYEKNDQAYVEEKNGSVVRRFVGYDRLEGESARSLLNSLYKAARLYVNYFQPSLKLASKEKLDGHVKKRYFPAKTPCQRLLEFDIPEVQKSKLRKAFSTLDPVALLVRIELLQAELIEEAKKKKERIFAEPLVSTPPQCGTEPSLISMPSKAKPDRKRPETHRKKGRKSIVPDRMLTTIHQLLKQQPTMTPVQLMAKLNNQHPGSFSVKQKQTLARIINRWLKVHPEY